MPAKPRRREDAKKEGFARYVDIGGKFDLVELVNVARSFGMSCIAGFKPNMHFFNEIALHGTREQMRQTEARWRDAGHRVESKKPAAAFGIGVDREPSKWVDVPPDAQPATRNEQRATATGAQP